MAPLVIVTGNALGLRFATMLRRHASMIVAITLIVLVAAACIVRTGPRRNRPAPAYRTVPAGDHRKGKHKKHRGRDLHDAPTDRAPLAPRY